jgi:hypothetical protein
MTTPDSVSDGDSLAAAAAAAAAEVRNAGSSQFYKACRKIPFLF